MGAEAIVGAPTPMSAPIAGPPAMSATNVPLARNKSPFIVPSIGEPPEVIITALLNRSCDGPATIDRNHTASSPTGYRPAHRSGVGRRCTSAIRGRPPAPLTASALSCPSAPQHGRTHDLLASGA